MRKLAGALGLSLCLLVGLPTSDPVAAFSCETGPFILFFPEGIPSASGEAMEILANSFVGWGVCGAADVIIEGHTDFNEDPTLAVDRAETVKAYYTARGISASQITIAAFGAGKPRRQNVAGKPEPENRRVEITFTFSKRRVRAE